MTTTETKSVLDASHRAIDAMLRHHLPTLVDLVDLVDGTRTLAETLQVMESDSVAVLQVLERSPAATPFYEIVRGCQAERITHDQAVREISTLYAEHSDDAVAHRDLPTPLSFSENPMLEHGDDRGKRSGDVNDIAAVTSHIRGMLVQDTSILKSLSCGVISIGEARRQMGQCDRGRGRVLTILTGPGPREAFLSTVEGFLASQITVELAVSGLIGVYTDNTVLAVSDGTLRD